MYQSQLLDAYKKARNYVQDKQIAHDLNVHPSRITEMRKGTRYISDKEAVFLAEYAKIDKELALLGVHADRNDSPEIKALWSNIAKKWNPRGLQRIAMSLTVLTVASFASIKVASECVLCILC